MHNMVILKVYAKYAEYAEYFIESIHSILFYLWWLENSVNVYITPVQRNGRQGQSGVRCMMVFVQKTGNFIWKH